jgi:leucyl-tRNA synthetase
VTYLVLAPENNLVKKLTTTNQKIAVEEYLEKTKTKTELERKDESQSKTGVFTGSYAINPVNQEKIPV